MTDEKLAVLEIKQDLSEIKADLKYHIKRTDLLEEAQAEMRKAQSQVIARVEPLEKHVAMWAGAGKALIVTGGLGALAKVIYDLFLR